MSRVHVIAIASSFGLLFPAHLLAHEVRPAYLSLREERPGVFAVLWKTPMRGTMRLALEPVFLGKTRVLSPLLTRQVTEAAVQTWTIMADEPLRGQWLRIDGLESTMTDALVRIEFADGTTWIRRFSPREPVAQIPLTPSPGAVVTAFFTLGVEHILFGIDHLLFVMALLLIADGKSQLVKTITAFTIAHSITLALAVLGFVHVPSAPVEAVIALSIVFVAAEIIRSHRGHASITARAPWIVAFTFGLLHGFGFAGALSETGLPEAHISLALLFFNLGVEAGQLLFVAVVLACFALIRRSRIRLPRWSGLAPAYAIGGVAMCWAIQRVAAF